MPRRKPTFQGYWEADLTASDQWGRDVCETQWGIGELHREVPGPFALMSGWLEWSPGKAGFGPGKVLRAGGPNAKGWWRGGIQISVMHRSRKSKRGKCLDSLGRVGADVAIHSCVLLVEASIDA